MPDLSHKLLPPAEDGCACNVGGGSAIPLAAGLLAAALLALAMRRKV